GVAPPRMVLTQCARSATLTRSVSEEARSRFGLVGRNKRSRRLRHGLFPSRRIPTYGTNLAFATAHYRDDSRIVVSDGPVPGLDHGRPLLRAALAGLDRSASQHGTAELETVCRGPTGVQYRDVSRRLRGAGAPAAVGTQPGRSEDARANDHF